MNDVTLRFRIPHSAFRIVAVALSILAILIATLRPAGTDLAPGWSFALIQGDEGISGVLENIILFVPFGVALALGRWSTAAVRLVALGTALSFCVEFAQQWIPGRDPSLSDLLFNTLGTATGVAIARTAPRWLAPPAPLAAWLALATALAAAAVWLGTGWLLRPMLPAADAIESWTPDLGSHMDLYAGRVLAVTGRLGHAEPVRIALVASPPPGRFAPLLDVDDGPWPAGTIVAVDRTDLVLRNRSRSMYWGLDRPDLRARGALAGIAPGDTVTVTAWTEGKAFCLALDNRRWCGLGYTMGDGWKLIFYPEHFPAGALGLLNALWLAGWCLGVGWWAQRARRHPATGAALVVVALTLLLGPGLVGLLATPVGEMLGVMAGVGIGWLVRRAACGVRGVSLSFAERATLH
ncbi:MAG TPA: VanZ family protein [Gemmatimonadales bacterium]